MRSHHESTEQIALFDWARWMVHQYPELETLHAIPNGGRRSKITAAIMKREGTKAGVSDIHLPVPAGSYASLYIELKAPQAKNKKGSPEQRRWIELVRQYNNYATICVGWQAAAETIENYLAGKL